MRILITNDDGIESAGIRALMEAALRRGHDILVAAPQKQCSANSQHITLTVPLTARKYYPSLLHCEAYGVSGTPADSVRLCRSLFMNGSIDFCVSGVNDGENTGAAVYYSGTVCAAREAAMLGLPAIAVSVRVGACPAALREAAERAIHCAEKMQGTVLPGLGVVNLNYPGTEPSEWKDTRICPLSRSCFRDEYVEDSCEENGERSFHLTPGIHIDEPEAGSDWYCLWHGHPTCTVLTGLADKNSEYAGKLQEILQ